MTDCKPSKVCFHPSISNNQPSIYDPPTPTRELIRNDPTPLETTSREFRKSILQTYNTAHHTITSLVDKWIGVEKEVETTLKEVSPKGEETILPGAVYVGIAGMGGSILARNRESRWRLDLW
jgi:MICOS complex subunit MIC26